MLQGKKQNISIHLWTSSAVCKSMHLRAALTGPFCSSPGVQWAACHHVTLRSPCCLLGIIAEAWSEVNTKWSGCLPGQDLLTVGRYCWRKSERGQVGKGKGMNGGVREGNGLGEMVQFFYFFYLFINFFWGGREGQKWRRRGAETFNLSLIFFKLLSSSALWMV